MLSIRRNKITKKLKLLNKGKTFSEINKMIKNNKIIL